MRTRTRAILKCSNLCVFQQRHTYLIAFQSKRRYLIKHDEEHQKSYIPRFTGGNKTKYSDIYKRKKIKKKNQSFWNKYKRQASYIFLGIICSIGFTFSAYAVYSKWKNKSSRKITEKLASTQQDQVTLNELATKLCDEYIMGQFNKPIKNEYDLNTGFKYIDRELSMLLSTISEQIYTPQKLGWNSYQGFFGCGSSNTFKTAYNYTLTDIEDVMNNKSSKYRKESVESKSYLYLNFQEIYDSKSGLENLIKYHWGYTDFDMKPYENLPENIDEYDILRKALLLAMNKQYIDNKSKHAIVLIIDSLDELITKDTDFKYWIMLLGAAVQQKICSIVSISNSAFANAILSEILKTTYGGIVNKTTERTTDFFSENEIMNILRLNMTHTHSKLLANKLYEITKGYPLLLSSMIIAMNKNELSITDVINDNKDGITKWFDDWYENVYFKKYLVPSLKTFRSNRMTKSEKQQTDDIKKLLKQCWLLISENMSYEDKMRQISNTKTENTDNETTVDKGIIDQINKVFTIMDVAKAMNCGVFFPRYIAQDIDIELTLPIIKYYWTQHSFDHIADTLLKMIQESSETDISTMERFKLSATRQI